MNIVLIPALLLLVGFSLYKKVLEPRRAGGGERPAKPKKERGKPAKSRAKEPRAKEARFKKSRAKETPQPAAAVGFSGSAVGPGSGSGSAAHSTARSAARPGSGRMGSVL
ncbi:MAG: hypothetical protein JO085_03305 [Acidimicrobiia bacterium]|nr:hypothetical protein [Acidimicrobiia bacterium]